MFGKLTLYLGCIVQSPVTSVLGLTHLDLGNHEDALLPKTHLDDNPGRTVCDILARERAFRQRERARMSSVAVRGGDCA